MHATSSGKLTVRKGWRASNRFSFHSFKRKRTSVLTRTACYREEMVKRCRSGITRSRVIKLMIFREDWREEDFFIYNFVKIFEESDNFELERNLEDPQRKWNSRSKICERIRIESFRLTRLILDVLEKSWMRARRNKRTNYIIFHAMLDLSRNASPAIDRVKDGNQPSKRIEPVTIHPLIVG